MGKTVPHGKPVDIELTAMVQQGVFDLNYANGSMEMKIDSETGGMVTPQTFTAPLKIELRAKTDSTDFKISYAQGMISLGWKIDPSELRIKDISDGKYYSFRKSGEVPVNGFVDIEWILGREFMAVKVNGEIRHIGNNYGYIRAFKENPEYDLSSAVTVATELKSTVTVESLRVTEI